jgi:hypothetical protein
MLVACSPAVDNVIYSARIAYHKNVSDKAIARMDYATAYAEWKKIVSLSYKMTVWDVEFSLIRDKDSLIKMRDGFALERDQVCQR